MGFFSTFIKGTRRETNTTVNTLSNEPPSPEIDTNIYNLEVDISNAQAVSDAFYKQHLENIKGFDAVTEDDCITRELTPAEIDFLKYLEGKAPEAIAGYWTHDVGINISAEIRIFLANGYLEYKPDPNKLTITELKPYLKEKGLKLSGKKSEHVQRFLDAYTTKELEAFDIPRGFFLTQKGKDIIKESPETLTHDPDFEQSCINLIRDGNYTEAYRKICLREIEKPSARGLGIDWKEAAAHPESFMPIIYDDTCRYEFMPDPEDTKTLHALRIFALFLGKNPTALSEKYISSWIPGYKDMPSMTANELLGNIPATRSEEPWSQKELKAILEEADFSTYGNQFLFYQKATEPNSNFPNTKEGMLAKDNFLLQQKVVYLYEALTRARDLLWQRSPKAVEFLDLQELCKSQRSELDELERKIRLAKAEYEAL